MTDNLNDLERKLFYPAANNGGLDIYDPKYKAVEELNMSRATSSLIIASFLNGMEFNGEAN